MSSRKRDGEAPETENVDEVSNPAEEELLPEDLVDDPVADDPDTDEGGPDLEVVAAQEDELPEEGAGLVDTDDSPDYLDDLRRLQAEFENYKKQVVRRQSETLERAAEALVTNLLPVLDAGDRARAHGSEEVAGLAGLLYDTLRKEGLESLGSQPGDGFDPNLHDAVAHEPADEEGTAEGAVLVEVLREGYTWKGRLLRPAMVRVKG
jgi:molecular chaperone GrpE